MLEAKHDWLAMSRKLDWEFSYVDENLIYPEAMCGHSKISSEDWFKITDPNKMTYYGYVRGQYEKESAVRVLRDALGTAPDFAALPASWQNALKLHLAIIPYSELSTGIGSLRNSRFGRTSAWRQCSVFATMDQLRHTQDALLFSQELLKLDPQFEWIRNFYYTNNWFSIAVRHAYDELFLTSHSIEYTVGGQFIYENFFSNSRFLALSMAAKSCGDRFFEKVFQSLQSDESKNAQVARHISEFISKHDPTLVQTYLDKWFWRCWLLFSFSVGITLDYLLPLEKRQQSFKEFVQDYFIPTFSEQIERLGLKLPWYWLQFCDSLGTYHHMLYATAYSYRSTLWFDLGIPSPQEREWLHRKYPNTWPEFLNIWGNIDSRWHSNQTHEFDVHSKSLAAFCDTCQMTLSGGSPNKNSALFCEINKRHYAFCSEPCRRIFENQPEQYSHFKGLIERIRAGEAPANIFSLLQYFGLTKQTSGKDLYGGDYKWNQNSHNHL